ncbi:PAAR domain-containing protein, partial [Pseudomonas sp. Fl4BN2]|nr:PAAR domain-containing protein [Pseudomonas sp. Fl4BN2]
HFNACSSYDEQAHLVSAALEGIPYYIETEDGRTFSGRVPASGLLPRIDTQGEEPYTVLWGDEALAKQTEAQA